MAYYLKFERGRHVDSAEFDELPDKKWILAPDDFSWEKEYYIDTNGKLQEMTEEDFEAENLELLKPEFMEEVIEIADNFRLSILPMDMPINEEYRIKADAARRVIELSQAGADLDKNNPDYMILSFEAEAREISVLELAARINYRAQESMLSMGVIAAFEYTGRKLVEEASDLQQLEEDIDALVEETRHKLDL